MSAIIASIRAEYERYQVLAERALEQVPEDQLSAAGPAGGNSLATIAWHLSGNLRSRFTDFLTTDGEKPWRNRDDEFAARIVTRDELRAQWAAGWSALYAALASLREEDLERTVKIRRQPLFVHAALHRSLAHVSYHVGQVVYLAHVHQGPTWEYLSIPPGGSAAYNAAPSRETPVAHVEQLRHERTAGVGLAAP